VLSACLRFSGSSRTQNSEWILIQEPLTNTDVVDVVGCRCDVACFRANIHVVVEEVVATGDTKHSAKTDMASPTQLNFNTTD
jgi:hypothetical protein